MPKRVRWRGRFSEDGCFSINSEKVRGEGVCYFLVSSVPVPRDIETAFYGRGGVSKVKAAAQEIANRLAEQLAQEASS